MSERMGYWPGEKDESQAEKEERQSQETFSFADESNRLAKEIRAQGQNDRTKEASRKWGAAQLAYNQKDVERAQVLLAEADQLLSEEQAA